MPTPPDICPVCGDCVPDDARACPGCGACEETGWSEDAKADNLGIPREDFDYEGFVREEFSEKPEKTRRFHPFWWFVALVLLILTVIGLVGLWPKF